MKVKKYYFCGLVAPVSVADQLRRKKDSLSKKNDFTTARKVERSTTGLERDIPPAATLLFQSELSFKLYGSKMWTSYHFSMIS